MSQTLRPDPRTPGRWVWTYPRTTAVVAAMGFALCAMLALGLSTVFAWLVAILTAQGKAVTLVDLLSCVMLGVSAAIVCLLANHTARNLAGRWRGSIAVTGTHAELDLAAHRSLIHAPPRVTTRLALTEIEAIQTRLESYRTLGMGQIQRSYRLRLHDGNHILLFEQRALGTNQASADMDELAQALSQRMGVPLLDLGMVEGRIGFLGIIGGEAAAWNTSPLSAERERAMWRRAALTGALPAIFILATLILRAFF